eukprot:COSAG01_NODE_8793_length_2657_cov_1.528147_1_plen_809_part_01
MRGRVEAEAAHGGLGAKQRLVRACGEVVRALGWERVFGRYDSDGSGDLDRNEVLQVLQMMAPAGAPAPVEADALRAMAEMDVDGGGTIEYPEFVTWYVKQDSQVVEDAALVERMFREADEDSGGTLDREEVGKLLMRLDPALMDSAEIDTAFAAMDAGAAAGEEELRQMWDQVDVDGSNTLDREEVRQVLGMMGRKGISEEGLDHVFAELDKDGSGDVDYEEFHQWYYNQDPVTISRALMSSALDGVSKGLSRLGLEEVDVQAEEAARGSESDVSAARGILEKKKRAKEDAKGDEVVVDVVQAVLDVNRRWPLFSVHGAGDDGEQAARDEVASRREAFEMVQATAAKFEETLEKLLVDHPNIYEPGNEEEAEQLDVSVYGDVFDEEGLKSAKELMRRLKIWRADVMKAGQLYKRELHSLEQRLAERRGGAEAAELRLVRSRVNQVRGKDLVELSFVIGLELDDEQAAALALLVGSEEEAAAKREQAINEQVVLVGTVVADAMSEAIGVPASEVHLNVTNRGRRLTFLCPRKKLDGAGDGSVDLDEFIQWWSRSGKLAAAERMQKLKSHMRGLLADAVAHEGARTTLRIAKREFNLCVGEASVYKRFGDMLTRWSVNDAEETLKQMEAIEKMKVRSMQKRFPSGTDREVAAQQQIAATGRIRSWAAEEALNLLDPISDRALPGTSDALRIAAEIEFEEADNIVQAAQFRVLALKRERSKMHFSRGRLLALGKLSWVMAQAKQLEPDRSAELRRVWAAVDADGSGSLDRSEVKKVLAMMGRKNVSKNGLLAVMQSMDKDGSGEVDFEEFEA